MKEIEIKEISTKACFSAFVLREIDNKAIVLLQDRIINSSIIDNVYYFDSSESIILDLAFLLY